ncbi:MAG: FAD-dependent monooxygenase, partial [Chitinophagaceae bacterium]
VLRRMLLDSLKPGTVLWDSHFISMEAGQSMDAKSRMNPGTMLRDSRENPKEANQSDHQGWTMHFKNGSSTYADLVIAADGANSKLRPYVTDIKPFFSGITMLEGNVYDAEKKVPNISALLKGGKIMAFGNKQDILMGQKGNGEIGFYASFYSDEDWAKTSGINFSDNEAMLSWFKKEYAGWSHVWDELFLQATTPFIPRPIYCIPFDQAWEPLPNLTLLGDAAHVMPPFAGEGVNMAMLDALELSEVFASPGVNSLHHAIAQYEISMRKRASSIAKESLENGQRMHAENALETMLDFFQGK